MYHPFLTGDEIYLRCIEKTDLEGNYFQWLNDQEVTRWMQQGLFPNSEEAMNEYYHSVVNSRTDMVLAIILKDGERHIGNIGLSGLNSFFRTAEVGILIGEKDCWGKGYASDAIGLLAAHCFGKLNLNRLSAGAVAENIGSIRAFEKAGFKWEGVARQAYFCEGAYHDCVNMGLLREDYEEG